MKSHFSLKLLLATGKKISSKTLIEDPECYIMTIDDLEMLLAAYKKDKSRFDAVVKALVENKRGGNDYKSVLEILNIYQAVGDMHFIEERDYFKKIVEKLEKKLGTHQ